MTWGDLRPGDVVGSTPDLDGAPVTVLILKRAGDTLTWLNLMDGHTHVSTRGAQSELPRYYALLAEGT